jgi:hypothetical protein
MVIEPAAAGHRQKRWRRYDRDTLIEVSHPSAEDE